jgi:3-oxoacyl-[acyl-carrier-protein] synthase-3
MEILNVTAEFGENLVTNKDIFKLNSTLNQDKLINKVGVEKRFWTTKDNWQNVINKTIDNFSIINKSIANKKCVVISICQTGARRFPGYSNEIQAQLGISQNSFCIDLSMGCSGYIYALFLIDKLINTLDYEYGIIHTADAYNLYITQLNASIFPVFGAASTITLIKPSQRLTKFDFMSNGESWDKLTFIDDAITMNGTAVYQYVGYTVSKRLKQFITDNYSKESEKISLYLHQASQVTLDLLIKNLDLSEEFLIPSNLRNYGNCTSSSIPLLIMDDMKSNCYTGNFFASGFGVGLSYGAAYIGDKK